IELALLYAVGAVRGAAVVGVGRLAVKVDPADDRMRPGADRGDERRRVRVVRHEPNVMDRVVTHLVHPELPAGRDLAQQRAVEERQKLQGAVAIAGPDLPAADDHDAVRTRQVVIGYAVNDYGTGEQALSGNHPDGVAC